MSKIVKKMKIMQPGGTLSDYVPIGAEAENINVDGESVKTKLGKKPYYYDTVADMKADTKLKAGDMAVTLGYYSVNDGGGATYKITNTASGTEFQEAVGNLYATILNKGDIKIECLGAYGDGTHDDYDVFTNALSKYNTILLSNKTYLLGTQLIIPSDKTVKGISDTLGYATLKSANGVKIAGQRITFKNVNIDGDTTGTNGLYCAGRDEGSSTSGANHFNNNIIENIIISKFTNGIYFSGVIWNNVFSNIRVNRCSYGLLNSSTYYIMTTEFNNVYFSGITTCDVSLYKTNAIFNYCNFGISATRCLLFQQQCNIKINNSNFECDKYIEGTGTLFEISGYNMSFNNCEFKICTANTMMMFYTGGAVKNLSFKDCIYTSVNLTSNNAMGKILSPDITGYKYKVSKTFKKFSSKYWL